jgi:hypothetical protein
VEEEKALTSLRSLLEKGQRELHAAGDAAVSALSSLSDGAPATLPRAAAAHGPRARPLTASAGALGSKNAAAPDARAEAALAQSALVVEAEARAIHARALAGSGPPSSNDIAQYNIILFSSIALVFISYFSVMALVNMDIGNDSLLYSGGLKTD